MLSGEAETFYLFQLASLAEAQTGAVPSEVQAVSFSLENFVRSLNEGFVVLDRDGVVKLANDAFLDLVQARLQSAVVGRNMQRWLLPSGPQVLGILDLVEQRGGVRSLRSTLVGELGGASEVAISAIGDDDHRPSHFALVFFEIASGDRPTPARPGPERSNRDIIKAPLEAAVRSSVETVEKLRLTDALSQSGGNRTLAAEVLGISRQSLHAKLRKYGLGTSSHRN